MISAHVAKGSRLAELVISDTCLFLPQASNRDMPLADSGFLLEGTARGNGGNYPIYCSEVPVGINSFLVGGVPLSQESQTRVRQWVHSMVIKEVAAHLKINQVPHT